MSWTFHEALTNADLPSIRIHEQVIRSVPGNSASGLTLDKQNNVIPGLHAQAALETQVLFKDRTERA